MAFLTALAVSAGSRQIKGHTKEFVVAYLQALGARLEWRDNELLRVELTRDQLCELENRPARTWYVVNNLPERVTIYLRFGGEEPSGEDTCESARHGSWRFQLMRESALRIGAVTRLRIVPSRPMPEIVYRQVLIFGFTVSFHSSLRETRLIPVAVDMVSGRAGEDLARFLLSRCMDEDIVSPAHVHRRELRYKDAFEIACECVKERVAGDEATWDWYHRAAYRLHSELARAEEYFAERVRDGESNLEGEKEHIMAEIKRRLAPRVEARPTLAIIAYCPEHELPDALLPQEHR